MSAYRRPRPLARRQVQLLLVGKRKQAQRRALPGRRQGQQPGNVAGHVELAALAVAHVQRAAHVEQHQHLLLLFLLVGFHERAVALAAHGPVDGPHLVAVLVEAHVVELQARALEHGMKVALQLGLHRFADADFEVAQAAHQVGEGRRHGGNHTGEATA